MSHHKESAAMTGEKIFADSDTINHSDDNVSYLNRFLLLLFALTIGLGSIVGGTFSGHDESRVAGIAWEMVIEKNYVVPRLNGNPFLEYPSLGYMPAVMLFKFTGIKSPFVAQLSSVLMGMCTVFITFLLGRYLGGEKTGLIAALFLQATFGFISLNSTLRVDSSLLFWITLSLYGFVAGYYAERKPFLYFILFYLGMAGAFLTKGLIGIGLPAVIAGVFILCKRDFSLILKLHPWWGIPIFALPVLGWAFCLYRAEGLDLLYEVWQQSLWRFLSSSTVHAQSSFYYVVPIFYLSFPWTLFLPIILWRNFLSFLGKGEGGYLSNTLLPKIWFVTVFIVLSIASAKRNVYLGPIYPALALMGALWWKQTATMVKIPWPEKIALQFLPYLGFICLITSMVVAFVKSKFILGMSLVGLAFLFGTFFFTKKFRIRRHAMVFFLCCYAISVLVIYHSVICPKIYSGSLQPFFNGFKPEWEEKEIVLYCPGEIVQGAAYFHFNRRVPMVWSKEELKNKTLENPKLLIIAYDIDPALFNEVVYPQELEILYQRNLKRHKIMLLSVVHSVVEN
jgi:4-amino-4-deoxy-L-arabinose transferase-like glycosyltransferase